MSARAPVAAAATPHLVWRQVADSRSIGELLSEVRLGLSAVGGLCSDAEKKLLARHDPKAIGALLQGFARNLQLVETALCQDLDPYDLSHLDTKRDQRRTTPK